MVNYIFYDDTDSGGIVYHAQYLVFCERARSLLFFQNNMLPEQGSCVFVVKKIESSFIASLKLGDQYEVKTTIIVIKHTSVVLKQEIFRTATMDEDSKHTAPLLVFSAQVQLAYIDVLRKRPCKIPDSMMMFLQNALL